MNGNRTPSLIQGSYVGEFRILWVSSLTQGMLVSSGYVGKFTDTRYVGGVMICG